MELFEEIRRGYAAGETIKTNSAGHLERDGKHGGIAGYPLTHPQLAVIIRVSEQFGAIHWHPPNFRQPISCQA